MPVSLHQGEALPEVTDLDVVSDEELARRVQSGCAAAFDELDRRMRPRLLAALCAKLRDRAACEDVVQETLLTAYRQIHRYDPQKRLSTWMLTIAFRLAIDEHRRQKRRPVEALPRTEMPSDTAPPDQHVAERESAATLWAVAREALDETAYAVLWLRLGEDLNVAETAAVLGKSAVHVRVLHHRAIGRLRKAMNRREDDQR